MAENKGDVTQLIAILPTLPQETASTPFVIRTKPIMEPTIEWVVDTGQPRILAMDNQVPPARSADIIPIIKILISLA